jgi:hypothetical protein
VEVKRYQDIPLLVATVDREEVRTLLTAEGLLVTMAAFHVRNNAKQFMTITLPGGAEVWGVFVAGTASKPGKDEKGRILIPLERSVVNGKELGAFTVEVIYVEKGKKLSAAGIPLMKLPAIDMPVSTLSFEALLPDEAFVVRSIGMKRTSSFQFSAHDALNYLSPANYLRARVQGQLTACKSNLKNIGTAMEMYGSDTTEALVPGLLPVRAAIPERGKAYTFEQIMLTSGSPAVRILNVSRSLAACTACALTLLLMVMFFGVFSKSAARLPGGLVLYRPVLESSKAGGITLPGRITLAMAALIALCIPEALILWGTALMVSFLAAAYGARKKTGRLRELQNPA